MLALLVADFDGHALGNALLRWAHVVAGVIWIGHLYFFNFVNSELAKTYDAETKKKVVPQLMPRALYWFRWGAAWTFVTGLLLLAMLYWFGPNFTTDGTRPEPVAWIAALLVLILGFVVYDQMAKALAGQLLTLLALWCAIVAAVAWVFQNVDFFASSHRAALIHAGALFGTAMAANVWMRIWPAQKRIVAAIAGGRAPEAADVALAGLRSKHNTFMSVPLLFLMLGVHQAEAGVFGGEAWIWVVGLSVVGIVATQLLYERAGSVQGAA